MQLEDGTNPKPEQPDEQQTPERLAGLTLEDAEHALDKFDKAVYPEAVELKIALVALDEALTLLNTAPRRLRAFDQLLRVAEETLDDAHKGLQRGSDRSALLEQQLGRCHQDLLALYDSLVWRQSGIAAGLRERVLKTAVSAGVAAESADSE